MRGYLGALRHNVFHTISFPVKRGFVTEKNGSTKRFTSDFRYARAWENVVVHRNVEITDSAFEKCCHMSRSGEKN
jgi:hypothetical protein